MKSTLRTLGIGLVSFLVVMLSSGRAEVKPNALISEGAVLQQKVRVPLWGTAKDGEKVTVEFQKQKLSTVATNGQWKVILKPLRPGGPYTLKITGENTLTFTNILVGEVWICSGQSNMQMALYGCEGAKEAIASANDPMLRLFTVPCTAADSPQNDVKGNWSECTSNTVAGFSGVAYYFGRDLRKSLKVPVGLVHTSWGGSPAETWTPRSVLEANPMLQPIVERHEQALKSYPAALEAYKKAEPELKAKYEEAAAKAKAEGKPAPYPPRPPADPAQYPHRPAALYNAMIAPLVPYAMRGAIWYQGESNAGRAYEYRTLFPTMIQSWRTAWRQDFPFLFVQIAPYGGTTYGPSSWAEVREAQLFTSQTVPKTAMAVIMDAGMCGNIHPVKKDPAGARLALAARAIAYGEHIVYSGPVYRSMKVADGRATLTFKNIGSGLVAKDGELTGFTIAGADQTFIPARAEIKGDRIVVWSPDVKEPVAVRYGWADCPSVNLFNKEGIPASSFRTDDFPMITKPK